MVEHLASVYALCGQYGLALPLALLLAGLAGSAMHCAPMCGPFVLGQVTDRLSRLPPVRMCEASRIRSGLLLPYHLGRLTTYALLGATAGQIGRIEQAGKLAGSLLLAGSALFLYLAIVRLAPSISRFAPNLQVVPHGLGRLIRAATSGIDRDHWRGGFLFGFALGWLPCGLLYAALTVSAGTGAAIGGAAAMLGFGLGTVPGLVVVGIAGHSIGMAWHRSAIALAPAVLMANALLLAVLGWQRLAGA